MKGTLVALLSNINLMVILHNNLATDRHIWAVTQMNVKTAFPWTDYFSCTIMQHYIAIPYTKQKSIASFANHLCCKQSQAVPTPGESRTIVLKKWVYLALRKRQKQSDPLI